VTFDAVFFERIPHEASRRLGQKKEIRTFMKQIETSADEREGKRQEIETPFGFPPE
jgi:hypothetical protein